jgi:hypothetical protein
MLVPTVMKDTVKPRRHNASPISWIDARRRDIA